MALNYVFLIAIKSHREQKSQEDDWKKLLGNAIFNESRSSPCHWCVPTQLGVRGGEGYVQVDQAPMSTWVCSYVHGGERCACGGGGVKAAVWL